MRSTIALSLAVAAVAVSAQDCNPTYNTPGSGECFTNCNIKAGSTYVSGWTMDHTSPKFLASLAIMCTKGTATYTAFMTTAGMCMVGCSDDPELFNAEFAGACAWYAIHKDDTCAAATTTTAAPVTTTTPATTTAAATTTTAVATTTTTVAAATSAVSSGASVAINGTSSVAIPVSSAASHNATTANSTASSASSAAPNAAQTGNAANKLQFGGYVVALVAAVGFMAL